MATQARRILVTGAAGAPALNYVRSLRMSPEEYYLIGVDSSRYQLAAAETDEAHLVPRAIDDDYITVLNQIIDETGAELVFAQPDAEVRVLSERRHELRAPMFLPSPETVSLCHDKYQTFRSWRSAGITVPDTVLVESRVDLDDVMDQHGDIWLRPATGAAGSGAFHTSDRGQAVSWLDSQNGWGRYTAAAYLSPDSVTWQSIWKDGHLVVAQGRKRLQWEFADRAPSGITGVTGVGLTVSDPAVDAVAMASVRSVDDNPGGIFSVDMTYDRDGFPNPTEINIGRFFTTSLFFTVAGLNMPYIFTRLAFGEEPPPVEKRINPLPPGLMWVRGMDREPLLLRPEDVESAAEELRARREGQRCGA
jgi:carbamoyl-phosphate synthase large subunit